MLIKQTDYHRIYSVINSLISSESGNAAAASMFFSVFGAFLLKQHFKIDATPKGGLAAYRFGDNMMLFADHDEDGFVTGEGNNFHCWVEAEGWAIDFMAPAFADNEHGVQVAPKMFQKPLSDMASSVNDLKQSGDFFYLSTPQATARRFADWKGHRGVADLSNLANLWFRKSPKKIMASMTVADLTGKEKVVALSGKTLTGSW